MDFRKLIVFVASGTALAAAIPFLIMITFVCFCMAILMYWSSMMQHSPQASSYACIDADGKIITDITTNKPQNIYLKHDAKGELILEEIPKKWTKTVESNTVAKLENFDLLPEDDKLSRTLQLVDDMGRKYPYADSQVDFTWSNTKAVSEGKIAIEIGNRWGYVDNKGKILIRPAFLEAGQFQNDYAIVRLENPDRTPFSLAGFQ